MQYEVSFVGGPLDGSKRVYGQGGLVGLLYAYKDLNGPWQYYLLYTTGGFRIPHHYNYLGSSYSIMSDADEAATFFANKPTN